MQYYTLIAGLPDISLDDAKSEFTVKSFKNLLDETLSSSDKKIIDSLFLKYDNENLLKFLKDKDLELDDKGTIFYEELADMVQEIIEVEKPLNKEIPPYFKKFIPDYLTGDNALTNLFWEDQLASLYYDYLGNSSNKFIREWAELNLNINNVMIALASRRNDIDYIPYIVGNNEVAETLKISHSRDFGISDIFEQFDELKRIDEETNIIEKEKKIDLLRWNWIEEKNFFNYFTIERVIGFLLELQMLERWLSLNEESGKQIFNEIVDNLKGSILEKKLLQ